MATGENTPRLICAGCLKSPAEIAEYVDAAAEENITPDQYVRAEEGTLNRRGEFLCTECYITAGTPSRPGGWTVPI